MKKKLTLNAVGLISAALLTAQSASAALIGWQTFENVGGSNVNMQDSTPDNNTTYDATPVGTSASNVYLTGAVGVGASSLGYDGYGINTNSSFLNGPGFGNESADSSRLIVNNLMADGRPGTRIGPNGGSGASSWKFGNSDNQRKGDVQITNNSNFYYRIELAHFDARVGAANSPDNLQMIYLAGNGTAFDNELLRFDSGSELTNLVSLYNEDYDPTNSNGAGVNNVSISLSAALGTQVYLAPGSSAAFRFLWTGEVTEGAQSQIDNLAFEGAFFETVSLATEIDPVMAGSMPANYYVSASSGSDTNNGLSSAAAFQSLARINVVNLQPGDSVSFKSGDSWKGMFWPKGSGTHSSPIRIDSYGGATRPIIDGDGYQASLLIFNDEYYEIRNLELTNQASYLDGSTAKKLSGFGGEENNWGSGRDVRFGIKIVASTQSLEYFRIADVYIHDVYPTPINTSLKHQGYGIKFESQSNLDANAIFTISDVDIDSATVSQTGHYGIWIKPLGLDGSDLYKHFDFTLKNSTFLNTGGSGFVAVKVANVLVENNHFDGTGSSLDNRMWARGSGLWPFDSKDVVIQGNTLLNAKGPLDSYGVHIDYNNENVVVQYNFSYNNEGGFVQMLGSNVNSGYRYNISVADGSRVQGVDGAQQNGRIFNVSDYCNISGGCSSTGNFIYNNTVFVPNTISPDIVFQAGSGETLFQNNLIYAQQRGSSLSTQVSQQGASYTIANNVFYPQEQFSLATELTSGAVYSNPSLALPGIAAPWGYKLKSLSPAKLAGVPIAGSLDPQAYSQNNGAKDFFGNLVPAATPSHIGAYNGNEVLIEVEIPLLSFLQLQLLSLLLLSAGLLYKRKYN